jgi:hypothetical protein
LPYCQAAVIASSFQSQIKMENTTPSILLGTSSGTTTINMWTNPQRVDVIELSDKIEFIYKETSMMQLAVYPPRPPQQRVFKIVFTCVDGKWNKSERVYGEIISAKDESYSF